MEPRRLDIHLPRKYLVHTTPGNNATNDLRYSPDLLKVLSCLILVPYPGAMLNFCHFSSNYLVMVVFHSIVAVNKTKDWAAVQNAALVIDIKVLKLG